MSATPTPQFPGALCAREAWPHPVGRIELIETHISWVLLTGDWAYKIKRPVAFPFADLRSLETRAHLCSEEVRLNRRFAPELYEGVVPITREDGHYRVGGRGRVIDYAVRLRQFERACELDALLRAGAVTEVELAELGTRLAGLQAGLPVARPADPWGEPQAVRRVVHANVWELTALLPQRAALLGTLAATLERRFGALERLMMQRRLDGRVREGHGDLHTRNIVRLERGLVPFDCIEFEPALRWIDVADEAAFLYGDLLAEGAPGHAAAFLSAWFAASGDYAAAPLLVLYAAHRLLVRAKVSLLSARAPLLQGEVPPQVDRRLMLAGQLSRTARARPPRLVVIAGLSGSGKSWLGMRMSWRLGAVHVRSDVERKRIAGLPPHARSAAGVDSALYAPERTAAVYDRLAQIGGQLLEAGFDVILDATALRRRQRAILAGAARGHGATVHLLWCEAPEPVLRERILQRERQGDDPSDATLAVLRLQQSRLEPPDPQEGVDLHRIDTADAQALQRALAATGGPPVGSD